MKNSFRLIQFLFISCLTLTTTVFADVKIKSRQTSQGQAYENTTYIKGKRQRSEQNIGGYQTVSITQCDLRRNLQIMPQNKVYLVSVFDESAASQATNANGEPATKGGVITTTVTNKDTGERKQMFGYTARRILTTMITESSPDACSPVKTKMEIDGWYIDAAFALDCGQNYGGYQNYQNNAGCRDKSNFKTVGTTKTGYPVLTKTTLYDENGKPTYSFSNEVIELSNATLDASLFDVPAGYREVKDASQLYGAAAAMNTQDENLNTDAGLNQNVQNLAKVAPQPATAAVGAKKTGAVRLGLARVNAGQVGENMNAADLAAAVNNSLANSIKGANVELVQVESAAEAKQKECDFVIFVTVSHKKGGGGFGLFKQIAPALGNVVSLGAASSTAGAIASSVVYTAASLSAEIKSKDEITLEYKLIGVNGSTPTLANTVKAKAKSNGQDIITPLVEQTAQAIVGAATK